MVIDTSALIAILQDEPERRSFNEAIEAADGRKMSVASFVEASMIIESRFGPDGIRALDLFIAKAKIGLVEVDAHQAHVARDAIDRFLATPANVRRDFALHVLTKVRSDA